MVVLMGSSISSIIASHDHVMPLAVNPFRHDTTRDPSQFTLCRLKYKNFPSCIACYDMQESEIISMVHTWGGWGRAAGGGWGGTAWGLHG